MVCSQFFIILPHSPTSGLARHEAVVQNRGFCKHSCIPSSLQTQFSLQLMLNLLLLLQEKRESLNIEKM